MPRSRMITMVALLACCQISLAKRDPAIDDFLNPIIHKIAADPNGGGWTWETNRNGGYLLRAWMDVNGDGRKELFVATTLQSAKYKQSWRAFEILENGIALPYNEVLEYSFAWPVTQDEKTCLVYVAPPDRERLKVNDERPYPVHRFTFNYPEIKKEISYANQQEAEQLRQIDPTQLPKLEAILLADYLTNPEAQWTKAVEFKMDANDCYYLEESKERAEQNSAFTPQVALSRLGAGQDSAVRKTSQSPTERSPTPRSSSSERKSVSMERGEITRPSASWGLIIASGMGIALTWLLLKKRK